MNLPAKTRTALENEHVQWEIHFQMVHVPITVLVYQSASLTTTCSFAHPDESEHAS